LSIEDQEKSFISLVPGVNVQGLGQDPEVENQILETGNAVGDVKSERVGTLKERERKNFEIWEIKRTLKRIIIK
jgi:hypothetical protein